MNQPGLLENTKQHIDSKADDRRQTPKANQIPALVVRVEKLKADKRDMDTAYNEKIARLNELIIKASFAAEQIEFAFVDIHEDE